MVSFPVINMKATGCNIKALRQKQGLTVKELQSYMGFNDPQAIYKWQRGQTLPTIDNLVLLSYILKVPMDSILVVESGGDPLYIGTKKSLRFRNGESGGIFSYPYCCSVLTRRSYSVSLMGWNAVISSAKINNSGNVKTWPKFVFMTTS